MKKILLILLLPALAFAQPPPISTFPLSVNPSTHVVSPTDMTSGMLTDAMNAMSNKPWCRLVSTTNIASLSGTTTIDSVAANAGDVVLLTAQTGGITNGPWIVASGAWTRPDWYASGHTTQSFLNIAIQIRGVTGTAFGGSWWRMATTGTITIDTTATVWVQAAKLSLANGVQGTLLAANFPALTGDVTTTAGSLATTIAAGAVTYAKIQNVAALSVFGRSANTSGVGADITGTDGQYLRVQGTTLGFGPFPTPTPFPSVTPFPSATPYPTPTPHVVTLAGDVTGTGSGDPADTLAATIANNAVTTAKINNSAVTLAKMANLAANSFIGNNTGSSAVPTALGITTGAVTFLGSNTSANLAAALTNETGTGVAVFNGAPTFTGLVSMQGSLQIGTGTTSPQPLFAVAPVSGPIAMTFKIPGAGDYAQLAYKNNSDAQRGFIGYIGPSFGNALRQNNFEFGTASGSKIAFRPGDGDGNQMLMDDNGNFSFKNSSPGSGAQGVIVFGLSGIPTTTVGSTGQLYNDAGTLKWRGSSGTVTAIAPP